MSHTKAKLSKAFEIKTYVVLQLSNVAPQGTPNVAVLAVKLTHDAAQGIVDAIPGTWIERHVATKFA